MMDFDRVDRTLAENRDELRRISDLEGFEQQGYAAAPILVAASGLDKAEVLKRFVKAMAPDDTAEDVQRTIGVIRWLIDNR